MTSAATTDHRPGGDRQVGVPVAEGVAHRPEADREIRPVLDRVELPVEEDEEAEVEGLDQHQHADRGPIAQLEAPGTARQRDGQGDDDQPFERESREEARRELPRPDRSNESDPDDRRASKVSPAVTTGCAGASRSARAGASSRCRHSHQTSRPNDSTSRARATASRMRLTVRGGTPDAAITSATPATPSPSCASHAAAAAPAARARPARREEEIARESDQEHPAARRRGDLDAEHEEQECVDLAVELRAQG